MSHAKNQVNAILTGKAVTQRRKDNGQIIIALCTALNDSKTTKKLCKCTEHRAKRNQCIQVICCESIIKV